MTEWVVTLRTGRRIDVDAAEYEHDGDVHRFDHVGYSAERVLCVQRRDGHLLEQVWPMSVRP